MTTKNDRPHLSSEGAPIIDKTILVNVNRNKYPVVRPSWALKRGLTDRLVVGRKVTLKRLSRSCDSVVTDRMLARASSKFTELN
jgi:hypothetical protein